MNQAVPTMPLAERESGLVVPAHLANLPEELAAEGPAAQGGRDADGRRRVVLDRETRKILSKLARNFGERDIAVLFHCRTHRQVRKTIKDAKTGENVEALIQEPIADACGEIMAREGDGTMDPGFGCKCSRVHFLASGGR